MTLIWRRRDVGYTQDIFVEQKLSIGNLKLISSRLEQNKNC